MCDKYALAAGNKGLYASSNVASQNASWERQNLTATSPRNRSCPELHSCPIPKVLKTAYAASRATGVWHGHRDGNDWVWTSVASADLGVNKAYVVLVNDDRLYVAGGFGVAQASPPLPAPGDTSTWSLTSDITTTTFGLSASASAETVLAAVFNRGVFVQLSLDEERWTELPGVIPNRLVYDAAANTNGGGRSRSYDLEFAPLERGVGHFPR